MSIFNESTSVLNTIAATGGDISLDNRFLNVTGLPAPISYLDTTLIQVTTPRVEQVESYSVTFTAANNTTYSFAIQQRVGDEMRNASFTFTTGSSGTALQIANAITSFLNSNPNGIQVTASGTSSPVTVTANAGYPLFNMVAGDNVTVASNMASATTAAGSGQAQLPAVITSITGTTTVTVTSTGHGLATGNVVTITGYAGTMNGVTTGVTARITYASANTFTLDGVVANTNPSTGSAVVTVVPQIATGVGANLVTAGVSGASATVNYTALRFEYGVAVEPLVTRNATQGKYVHTMYVSANLAASPYTATTNYADFITELNERRNAYTPSTTDADPEILALGV